VGGLVPAQTAYNVVGTYRDTGNRALRNGPGNYGYNAESCLRACS